MFRTMHFAWTTQLDWALLEGERYAAARFEVLDVQTEHSEIHHLGYELKTPKMPAKLRCLSLHVGNGPAQLFPGRHLRHGQMPSDECRCWCFGQICVPN